MDVPQWIKWPLTNYTQLKKWKLFLEQHIFEEPGKLLEVNLAITWYKRHLVIKEMSSLKF
jgi:hypothetical protein